MIQDDTLTQRARQVFAHDRYATEQTGIELTTVGDGMAVCRLTLTEQHRNAKGAVMGGVLFTLADLAFAAASNSDALAAAPTAEAVELLWVSSAAEIHFLGGAHGDTLEARCEAVKRGRNMAVFQSSIIDETGHMVALVTTTGAKIK